MRRKRSSYDSSVLSTAKGGLVQRRGRGEKMQKDSRLETLHASHATEKGADTRYYLINAGPPNRKTLLKVQDDGSGA